MPFASKQHTILLIQPLERLDSRTYSDYENMSECMDGICKIFEEHLKKLNPSSSTITYDVSQLFDFIDDLPDLGVLTQNYQMSNMYIPEGKDWVKKQLFDNLRQQAYKQ